MAEAGARQIVLKSEYKNVTVSMDTILYIESVDNYVKLHLTDGKTILSKISLMKEFMIAMDFFEIPVSL